jgi:YegS/Rv2252/BmrU family lipid kinase
MVHIVYQCTSKRVRKFACTKLSTKQVSIWYIYQQSQFPDLLVNSSDRADKSTQIGFGLTNGTTLRHGAVYVFLFTRHPEFAPISMAESCVILLNNKAGALHASAGKEQIEQLARDIELDAQVRETQSAEHLRATVRDLVKSGVPRIAVAGGDGTVALAVQEMVHTNSVLGILPQGTFNNFATALRLPQDLPTAMRALLDGEERAVDVGLVRSHKARRYFTEGAGIGLFADVLAVYGAGSNKNLARGMYAMIRVLSAFRPRRLTLNVDGKTIKQRAVMCTVANVYRLGQAIPIAPGAQATDGELDVVIIGALKRGELLPYYRAIRAQSHGQLPKVTTLRAHEVHIRSRHHLNVHCDDHIIGTTPAHFSIQAHALKVLVGRL